MFNMGLYWENVKKSSCLKPQGLEPVASTSGPLHTPGAKNGPALGVKYLK